MARIAEKVKIYIHQDNDDGKYMLLAHESNLPWLTLVGTVDALIEFDESDLKDIRAAQLEKAERELEEHRAEFAVKERQLLDKIESLRALPHLGDEA